MTNSHIWRAQTTSLSSPSLETRYHGSKVMSLFPWHPEAFAWVTCCTLPATEEPVVGHRLMASLSHFLPLSSPELYSPVCLSSLVSLEGSLGGCGQWLRWSVPPPDHAARRHTTTNSIILRFWVFDVDLVLRRLPFVGTPRPPTKFLFPRDSSQSEFWFSVAAV